VVALRLFPAKLGRELKCVIKLLTYFHSRLTARARIPNGFRRPKFTVRCFMLVPAFLTAIRVSRVWRVLR
jgi:hypothetical protein